MSLEGFGNSLVDLLVNNGMKEDKAIKLKRLLFGYETSFICLDCGEELEVCEDKKEKSITWKCKNKNCKNYVGEKTNGINIPDFADFKSNSA